jgi:hypothetical protein
VGIVELEDMGQLKIHTSALWFKHIQGDPALRKKLESLPAGKRVRLWVGGVELEFEKMRDRPDGPTPGLKPVEDSKRIWSEQFYPKRVDEFLEITMDDLEPIEPAPSTLATAAERDAAWEALKSLAKAGWSTPARHHPPADRDDLHQR